MAERVLGKDEVTGSIPVIGSTRLAPEERRRMERETGIEPATNSLEGCDSTTELLPPSFLDSPASERSLGTSAGRPASA